MDLAVPLFAIGGAVLAVSIYKLSQMSKEPDGWWTTSILEGRKVKVKTDWNLCMGAGSCTELAPGMFRLDWSKKKSRFDPAPLEMLDDKTTKAEEIFRAAQSCPYRAIILEDAESGERLFPV
ncbi:MAG: ferredoxin [Nitrososphaerota archaeon]|nr:ferredoxin [Nitrososphaerota archaeon]MDG6990005.1 ferredoxin [Nitrososphaerota archaeon]